MTRYITAFVAGVAGGILSFVLCMLIFPQQKTPYITKEPGVRQTTAAEVKIDQGKVLSATAFKLVDKSGKARAELCFDKDGHPGLTFFSKSSKELLRAGLTVNPYDQFDKEPLPESKREHPTVDLTTEEYSASITAHPQFAVLNMMGPPGADMNAQLRVDSQGAGQYLDGRYSKVCLREGNKYRAVLGSVRLEHPKTEQETITSLSSMTLFGKDGKVLWTPPIP
jgi:hypothetical protein